MERREEREEDDEIENELVGDEKVDAAARTNGITVVLLDSN